MAFRRGFKSQCERRAVEYRKQLGLNNTAPLSAEVLAQHLGVTVWSTDDIAQLSANDVEVLNLDLLRLSVDSVQSTTGSSRTYTYNDSILSIKRTAFGVVE